MNDEIVLAIPLFKEVYSKSITNGMIKTVCELKTVADNRVLAYGISRLPEKARYNKALAKKISYSIAVRILFLKIAKERTVVEDTIPDEEYGNSETEGG